MKIAGVQKTSLIDYPENIAIVIFTQGCNMRCPYCHNPELVISNPESKNELIDEKQVRNFILKRKGLIDGVVITGGEPLLQQDLGDFIIWIKQQGFKIKLDTNGSEPDLLKELINLNAIDYIAMDYKFPIDRYHVCKETLQYQDIEKSRDLILNLDIDYEFRTTLVPALHHMDLETINNDMEQMARELKGAKKYVLQNFRNGKCLDESLSKMRGFSIDELLIFQNIARKYIKDVEIRS